MDNNPEQEQEQEQIIAKEEIFEDLERAKTILPESVTIQAPQEKPEVKMPQPGDPVGQRRNV